MKNKILFIDMDDVLCDFHSAYESLISPEKPEFSVEQWNRYKESMTADVFANLEPMPWFESLKALAMDHGAWMIITSAELAQHIDGKLQWLQRHWPEAITTRDRRLIISQAKYLCAGRDRLLIDDYWKNIAQWEHHGGDALFVPAPHHSNYSDAVEDFNICKEVKSWLMSTG